MLKVSAQMIKKFLHDFNEFKYNLDQYVQQINSHFIQNKPNAADNYTKSLWTKFHNDLFSDTVTFTNFIEENFKGNCFGAAQQYFNTTRRSFLLLAEATKRAQACLIGSYSALSGLYSPHSLSFDKFNKEGLANLTRATKTLVQQFSDVNSAWAQDASNLIMICRNSIMDSLDAINSVIGQAEDIKYFVNNLLDAAKRNDHRLYQNILSEVKTAQNNLQNWFKAHISLQCLDYRSNGNDIGYLGYQLSDYFGSYSKLMDETANIAKQLTTSNLLNKYVQSIQECLNEIQKTTSATRFNLSDAKLLQNRIKNYLNQKQINKANLLDKQLDRLYGLWSKQRKIIRFA